MKTQYLKSDDGFATLIALIMVGMLTLIGLAAMSTSDDEVAIAGNELQEMRAFYAAEAGLEVAASVIEFAFDSTGILPTTLPSGSEKINGCVVNYAAVDNGPAQVKALTTGTLAGLNATVKTLSLSSTAINDIDNAKIEMSVNFEAALIPIFQFAVFYLQDLEIAPGPSMDLLGRIHTNGNLYLQAGTDLEMDSYVTAVGNIFHGRKGPGVVDNGDILIKDATGNYVSMKEGAGWLDASDPQWYDSSVARWQGRVQDSTHGTNSLTITITGSTKDPHKMIEPTAAPNPDSYEEKSTLKIIDGKASQLVGGIWVDVTADMVAKGIITISANQFYDAREDEYVDVTDLDVGKLYSEGYGPVNGVLYFSDKSVGVNWGGLRLTNGKSLDTALTIASENPLYTVGDFNTNGKKPVALMADAITILSSNWDDLYSDSAASTRVASETTVNASFITGNVETTVTDYNGGYENLPRFLEDWSGRNFNWTGSMASLWLSTQADGTWNGSYYSPPNRNWQYDIDLDDIANMPPETPTARVFLRTGWQQKDVGYQPVSP